MHGARFLTLVLAGICSLLLTAFALIASAWVEIGNQNPILVTLFWLLPVLAFPVFLLRLLWARMPDFAFWVIWVAQILVVSARDWIQCAQQNCTTTNPFLKMLSELSILQCGSGPALPDIYSKSANS